VDALVRQESARRKGDAAYRARTATVQGTPFPSAPNNARPADRRNTLTVELDRSYGRFKAGVGREDDEHLNGPAYCRFELYGDSRLLFKSGALRSPLTQVRTGPNPSLRKYAEPVDVSVRGVATLTLVTRFADEFLQEGPLVNRASGCVWGSARLLPQAAESGDVSARRFVPDDVLRGATRSAALSLAAGLGKNPEYGGRLPLTVALSPLRIEPGTRVSDEPGLREFIAQQLFGVRFNSGAVFRPLRETDAGSVAAALPPSGKARDAAASVAAVGRGVGADFMLLGAVTRAPDGGSVITLRLLETRKGRAVRSASQTF
jgi:hypothetical protein